MSTIPKNAFKFLSTLKKNNHRDWMTEHKKEYLANEKVLKAFYASIEKSLNETDEISKLKVNMSPNITVLAAYKNYKKLPISSIKFNDQIIAWAAQENTKNRFESNQILWTVQCTEAFSKKIINLFKENKNKHQSTILKKFEFLLGYQTKNIVFKGMHGWKYAYNKTNTGVESLWLNKYKLGVCADWFSGPKAEHAWLSAKNLFFRIKKKPT